MEDYKFLFKVVLVGNAGVGKTCLVRRFTQGLFPPGQGATIGVDFMIKTVEVDGEKVKVSLFNTCTFLASLLHHFKAKVGIVNVRFCSETLYFNYNPCIKVYHATKTILNLH